VSKEVYDIKIAKIGFFRVKLISPISSPPHFSTDHPWSLQDLPLRTNFFYFSGFLQPQTQFLKTFATNFQSSSKVDMTLTSFQSANICHTDVLTNDIVQGNFNILSFHF